MKLCVTQLITRLGSTFVDVIGPSCLSYVLNISLYPVWLYFLLSVVLKYLKNSIF